MSTSREDVLTLKGDGTAHRWQELLMERLRNKATQQRSFPELAKSTRVALLEKRYALDLVEKENLQKCLDSMQHCIKVTTKQGLEERLESLTRTLGLKYMEENSSLFISSDMFYLEILLDDSGSVQDVKVHHECKSLQSCSELVDCLVKGDFADFTVQLEGLASIYQLNAEPKIKSKAFSALQAVEQDVSTMAQLNHQFYPDVQSVLMQSPTGLVQKRRGGHPMKLTFFISPMELLDAKSQSLLSCTAELVHTKRLGQSVTINLEASVAHKLQIAPTLNVTDPQKITYDPMTTFNSTMLPASFVLTLNKPMPVCRALFTAMTRVTELPIGGGTTDADANKVAPIMTLIATSASNGLTSSTEKGLFVALPDQSHCYFMTDNRELAGEMVASIPFTEPAHVFELIKLLRKQAIFNALIASCVRPNSKPDLLDALTIFEVTALSVQQINVALEHPLDDSMINVEFDLSNVASLQCRIFPSSPVHEQLSVKLCRIAQTCMSIPVTMRALIKTFEQANRQQTSHGFGLTDGGGGVGSGGSSAGQPTGMDTTTSGGGGDVGAKSAHGVPLNGNHSGVEVKGATGNLMTSTAMTPVTNAVGGHFDNAYNVFDPGSGGPQQQPQQSQQLQSGQGVPQQLINNASVSAVALTTSLSIAVPTAVDDSAEGMTIKKRRVTGEDFWRSPKRTNNKLATDEDAAAVVVEHEHQRSGANEDSNSLGGTSNNDGARIKMESTNMTIEGEQRADRRSEDKGLQDQVPLRALVNGDSSSRRIDAEEDDSVVRDEDDDLGNILNELKNNKELKEFLNKAAETTTRLEGDREKVRDNKDNSTSGGGGQGKLSIEAQLARMGTPYVSITQIPVSNWPASVTTTSSTTMNHHHHQQQQPQQQELLHHQRETSSTTTSSSTSSSSSASTTTATATLPQQPQRISPTSGSSSPSPSADIKSVLSDMGITTDRRLAIEIIPLSPTVVAAAQQQQHVVGKSTASVTITPIDVDKGGQVTSGSNKGSKKSSSSSSSTLTPEEQERARASKKRRMEEYSEKETKRKSQSTSGGRGASVSPKYTPSSASIFNSSTSGGGRGSPKQSQASPKGDSRSPYSHSASQSPSSSSSSSGSGKPSMSTLKSAAVGGSPKGEKSQKGSSSDRVERSSSTTGTSSSSSGRDRDREREKKLAGSPKIKPSSVKLKPIDLNAEELSQDGLRGLSGSLFQKGGGGGGSGSSVLGGGKAKSSLSAVIDKLKSAQGPEGEPMVGTTASEKQSRTSSSSGGGGKVGDGSYVIKPSSDGMKLTINKTKSRSDGVKSSSSSSQSLPRSQSSSNLKVGSNNKKYGSPLSYSSSSSSSSGKSKLPFQKSSSSGSLSSSPSSTSGYKSSSSSSEAGKSNLEKKFSKLSPSLDGITKASTPQDVLKLLGLPSSNSMDGFMKSLDRKFQIPKLSARSSSTEQEGSKRSGNASTSAPTTPTGLAPAVGIGGAATSDPKLLTDFLTKEVPLKYPFPLNLNTHYATSAQSSGNRSSSSLKANSLNSGSEEVTMEKVVNSNSNSNSNSTDALSMEPRFNAMHSAGDVMRPPTAPFLNHTGDSFIQSVVESAAATVVNEQSPATYSKLPPNTTTTTNPSPSVSLHIVKSPVPSPKLIVPSPHCNSPSIDDDELMDEALRITGK